MNASLDNARLDAASGLGPKEPAAFVVEADGRRLLLDCGEGPEPGRLPDVERIGRVDAVLLSHGHNDHVGALRLLDRIGRPPVFATAPVLARLKGISGHAIPIRGQCEILGIKIETGTDGHAPGGVWLRLAVGDGLLYMGDYSFESRLYAFDQPPPTPTMIFDGSYGDAEEAIEPQYRRILDILARGPTLLPVPPDGRGPEIAMVLLEAGFAVAIDDQVRSVATMLTQAARESARPDSIPRLERLIGDAIRLDADAQPFGVLDDDAHPFGVMVAHGGSGDAGVAGALIKRWEGRPDPIILFTGHVAAGTSGRRLVDSGRALFQRWNVHPRASDNLALIESVKPQRVIPAFGEGKYAAFWRSRMPQRQVLTATPISL
jgi:Cft2 family RNA processing exonuclease